MKIPLGHGRPLDLNPSHTPLVTLAPIWYEGRWHQPRFTDRHILLLFKRKMEKEVSFVRAYRGWRASGAIEEQELGEGRAFLRWLMKHELSIQWKKKDITINPLLSGENSPCHDPADEMAQNLSFAIRPVEVGRRAVKLYVQDNDMLSLLGLPYGEEEDFLGLVKRYVAQRFEWEKWRAPAPPFLDWVTTLGKRPRLSSGEVGLALPHGIR